MQIPVWIYHTERKQHMSREKTRFHPAPPGWWMVKDDETEAVPIAGWVVLVWENEVTGVGRVHGDPVVPTDEYALESWDSTGWSQAGEVWYQNYLPNGLPDGITVQQSVQRNHEKS